MHIIVTQALYRFEWAFHVHISFYLTNDIQPNQGQIMLYIHIKKKEFAWKKKPSHSHLPKTTSKKKMLGQLNLRKKHSREILVVSQKP